jgi:hypothetical protein
MQPKNTVLKRKAKKGTFGLDRDNRQKVPYLLLLRTKLYQCQSNLFFQMLEKITQFLFRTDQSSIVSHQSFLSEPVSVQQKPWNIFFVFYTYKNQYDISFYKLKTSSRDHISMGWQCFQRTYLVLKIS